MKLSQQKGFGNTQKLYRSPQDMYNGLVQVQVSLWDSITDVPGKIIKKPY